LVVGNSNYTPREVTLFKSQKGCFGQVWWILMDLTYQMLGAFLGDEGPLTTAEFHIFINQPQRRQRLRLIVSLRPAGVGPTG